jgi:hypothetical protein
MGTIHRETMICIVIFTATEKERIKMKKKNFCRTWQVTDEKTEAWRSNGIFQST